jgi:oxygen-independent coproporphyrinogen III oxidase
MLNDGYEIIPSRENFITNYPNFRYWKGNQESYASEYVNIYIHIPFCMQRCAYCYYFTLKYSGQNQVEEYLSALCHEIKLKSQEFSLHKRKVKSIYFGGGTPSILKKDQLFRIKQALLSNFSMDDAYEFTMEAEPHTITPGKVKEYKEIGITRISLGIQSFSDHVIQQSERRHTKQKALDVINIILNENHHVLNIDLLSGLVGDTIQTWEDTIDTALSSGVHNITIYKMEAYSNTSFFKQGVRNNTIELPSDQMELEFMKLALRKIDASNYKPWATFAFIKDGKYAHDYIYNIWHGEDLCSFGASAYSKIGDYCHQNVNSFKNYVAKIAENQLPIYRGHHLSSKDKMVQDILLNFKFCSFSREHFARTHGFDLYILLKKELDKLLYEEFIIMDDKTINLTMKGTLYGDFVGKYIARSLKNLLGHDDFNIN